VKGVQPVGLLFPLDEALSSGTAYTVILAFGSPKAIKAYGVLQDEADTAFNMLYGPHSFGQARTVWIKYLNDLEAFTTVVQHELD
jgi:hypothetical protein